MCTVFQFISNKVEVRALCRSCSPTPAMEKHIIMQLALCTKEVGSCNLVPVKGNSLELILYRYIQFYNRTTEDCTKHIMYLNSNKLSTVESSGQSGTAMSHDSVM